MTSRFQIFILSILTTLALPAFAQDNPMSFFVTSDAPGNGGDLGGLAGADALCQQLADPLAAATPAGTPI
ncbi:MAG: hypothetical protein ACFHHU_14525 [Porticoccaceae bacterium]